MASTSNTSNSSNGEKERPPNTFNDRFEQLLLHEITPTLWLSVYRSKVLNAAVYVDIREKRERKNKGERTFIPTKFGVFLRRMEFDELQEIYQSWQKGSKEPNIPHEIFSEGRRVIFSKEGDRYRIFLTNHSRLSDIILTAYEMEKLAQYNMAEALASVLAEINWD